MDLGPGLGGNLEERGLGWGVRMGFAFHKVSNPLVRLLLSSPFHSMLSGHLILITYTGKRSGKKHSLPVQYAKSGDELIVVAGYHQHKRWWRNLLQQSTIDVRYRGSWFEAVAKAYVGDVEAIAPVFPDYLRRYPMSARYRGLKMDPSGKIEDQRKMEDAVKNVVMVRIRILDPKTSLKRT